MSDKRASLAKITRPTFSGLLRRERLFELLDEARGRRAVWITGPPGCGKTTLAANDLANQTGVLTGSVTNMMTGKGRFQFNYQGEPLSGEATRVSGDERKGVASAYGPRGTYARCEYQMTTAYQGAGLCTFSNGAEYQVHIGG